MAKKPEVLNPNTDPERRLFFGSALQSVRQSEAGHRFDKFAQTLRMDAFSYTQIESGRASIPTRKELDKWTQRLGLTWEDSDFLFTSAGYELTNRLKRLNPYMTPKGELTGKGVDELRTAMEEMVKPVKPWEVVMIAGVLAFKWLRGDKDIRGKVE